MKNKELSGMPFTFISRVLFHEPSALCLFSLRARSAKSP